MTRRQVHILVAFAALLIITWPASADPMKIDKDYNLYGHLWNTLDGTNPPSSTNPGEPWCAATATMNSFIYLQNKYKSVYDSKLTGNDPVAARNALNDLIGGNPTADKWWEGKLKYIEKKAPGSTVFHGMTYWDPTTWYRGSILSKGVPTWLFLWNQMKKCEDVEIGITWGTSAHALTLTSITLDDKDKDGDWDWDYRNPNATGNEKATIDYIDPNNPTKKFEATLSLAPGGDHQIEFRWDNGRNLAQDVWIDVAYAESPIPAPGAVILAVVGLGLVGWVKRRLQ